MEVSINSRTMKIWSHLHVYRFQHRILRSLLINVHFQYFNERCHQSHSVICIPVLQDSHDLLKFISESKYSLLFAEAITDASIVRGCNCFWRSILSVFFRQNLVAVTKLQTINDSLMLHAWQLQRESQRDSPLTLKSPVLFSLLYK